MAGLKKRIKRLFWILPIPAKVKEKMRLKYATMKEKSEAENADIVIKESVDKDEYIKHVLSTPEQRSEFYKEFETHSEIKTDKYLLAYYLTQFHPNPENDLWWGRGTTEWNNVSKAVPQFAGHYQPRLPGELGYYDLRIEENMQRQIELAKNYGVNAFCFYYYWFDGKRLLERPLNLFLQNQAMDIDFCVCWANENWTKRFSGTNTDVLMKVGDTAESCINFIYDILDVMSDERYFCINGCPVLVIYRPALIVDTKEVLKEWRKIVKEKIGKDIYIIAVQEKGDTHNWVSDGYDAETEFQPKRINNVAKDITNDVNTIRKDFDGTVYDYEELVNQKQYVIKSNVDKKVYPAVMPMWDNTARRNHKALIYHGSTPLLYKKWLINTINQVEHNKNLDKKMIFINAWNEWGEGAYLEPDRKYGYAYLQATYEALQESEADE